MFRINLAILAVLSIFSIAVRAGTNDEGLKFLEENKQKDGVLTLPSGLQYKVLKKGDGMFHPTIDSPCSCHYEGTLIDGTKFDSSYDRGSPTAFAPNQVIKGWTEAMQLMVVGDKWEMYIPSELGYGDQGSPPKIPGGSVLVFKMEMLEIKGERVKACRVSLSGDSIESGDGCSERENGYIKKAQSWDEEKLGKEIKRLASMEDGQMKKDLLEWIQRRTKILTQLRNLGDWKTEL